MKNKIILALTLSLSSLMLSTASAEEIPQVSNYDNRVQNVIYNPANVTLVKVKAGVATLIQLSDKEYIGETNSGFAIGYPMAWDISIKQNNIFIRPKADNPDTNVVFTTNKRTYVLNLVSVQDTVDESGEIVVQDPTFYLKYQYPQDEKEERERIAFEKRQKANAERKKQAIANAPKAVPCTNGVVNLEYKARGSNEIMPYIVWDDGEFTCMKWDSTKELPVVYKQLVNGTEILSNTHMSESIMVVHETSPRFVLRHGKSVVEIVTTTINQAGFNKNGTTVRNQRLIKK